MTAGPVGSTTEPTRDQLRRRQKNHVRGKIKVSVRCRSDLGSLYLQPGHSRWSCDYRYL